MKKFILSFIYTLLLAGLLSYNLFAQPIRYISPNGNNSNGQTWATAWNSTALTQARWNELRGGGYLYIDGGVDSMVYNTGLNVQAYGTKNQRLFIIAGKYSPSPSSHSGRVVFRNTSGPSIAIDACSGNPYYDWIYIKGIESQHSSAEGVYLHCDVNNIVIDSVWIENPGGQGIFVNGDDDWSGLDTSFTIENVEIKHCTIISRKVNMGVDDNIYAQKNSNLIIHHNFLHQRNQQTGDGSGDHIDNIQTANASSNLKIYNNICIVDSGVRGHAFILGQFAKTANFSDTVLVYNNFIRNGGHIVGDCYYQQVLFFRLSENFGAQPYVPRCYAVNNTVIVANRGTQNIVDGNPSFESNNIILQYGENGGTPGGGCALSMWSSSNEVGSRFYKYVDSCHTNLLYRAYGTGAVAFDGDDWIRAGGGSPGRPSSWSDFINNWGGTGVNANPLMVYNFSNDKFNKTAWNTDIVKIRAGSPAINAGTNMSYLIIGKFGYLPEISTNDILGNPRDANWDIGCFEYGAGGWTPPDTIPSFSFTALTNRELNTEYIATSPIAGVDSVSHFWTTTGAEFKINYNGTYNTTMKSADPDNGADTIYVKNLTGGLNSHTYTETIVGGGNSQNFNVTTKASTPGGEATLVRFSNGKIIRDTAGKIIRTR